MLEFANNSLPPMFGWLTVREVARRLGRSNREVLTLIHRGPMNASWIGGRLMIHSSSLSDIAPTGIVSVTQAYAESAS